MHPHARAQFRLAPYVVVLLVALFAADDWGLIDLTGQVEAAPKPRQVAAAPLSKTARAEIPRQYLSLYRKAGKRYDVPWTVLAGIGKVESDHGRSRLPGVRSGANAYGACGPMQIGCVPGSRAGNSWARYGHGSPHDPDNAIPAAARYLVGHGGRRNLARAIYGYNHAGWYAAKVQAIARRYQKEA